MNQPYSRGLDPYYERQLSSGEETPARIAGEHRHGYVVWSSAGDGFARLAGRLVHTLQDEEYPAVGDWVVLRALPLPGHTSIIDRVLTRRTVLMRGAAGRQARGQVIAANIDIVFIVSGLDVDFNVRRIQRYLARVSAGGALPVIVLNKTDICDDIDSRVAEVKRVSPGTEVITTSVTSGEEMQEFTEYLRPGITAAFVGSSGAGKSTLMNVLLGETRLRTGEVRTHEHGGRHTTTHRHMLVLPSGAMLIDTPGMRELSLIDREGIDTTFSGIEELASQCRFRDCTHQSEPGCAVRHAVESGEIPSDLVEHYLALQAEARAFELRHDERARRRSERATGRQRAKDLNVIRRVKEGR